MTLSARAPALAAQLREAAAHLVAAIEPIDEAHWRRTSEPDVWSISKDAAHVVEAFGYHQWIIRRTIGDAASSRRPVLERAQMTSELSRSEAIRAIRQAADEAASRILNLTDAQLDLPTRPRRARDQILAETIDRVLIGHLDAHRHDIEVKLRELVVD